VYKCVYLLTYLLTGHLIEIFCCRLCQQNLELLNAEEDSDVWKAYVDYVDEIIVDGFFNTIMCSLKFMIENTDAVTTTEPLYEAVLELQVCAGTTSLSVPLL